MSLSRIRTVSGALLLAGALVMTACSNGDQTSSSGGGGGDGKVTSVGVMLQDISNPFFASMQKSLQDAGKKQGFKVNVQDGRQDLGTQNDQIDAFIQQGVDLILLNAVDSNGIASGVARAFWTP